MVEDRVDVRKCYPAAAVDDAARGVICDDPSSGGYVATAEKLLCGEVRIPLGQRRTRSSGGVCRLRGFGGKLQGFRLLSETAEKSERVQYFAQEVKRIKCHKD